MGSLRRLVAAAVGTAVLRVVAASAHSAKIREVVVAVAIQHCYQGRPCSPSAVVAVGLHWKPGAAQAVVRRMGVVLLV